MHSARPDAACHLGYSALWRPSRHVVILWLLTCPVLGLLRAFKGLGAYESQLRIIRSAMLCSLERYLLYQPANAEYPKWHCKKRRVTGSPRARTGQRKLLTVVRPIPFLIKRPVVVDRCCRTIRNCCDLLRHFPTWGFMKKDGEQVARCRRSTV